MHPLYTLTCLIWKDTTDCPLVFSRRPPIHQDSDQKSLSVCLPQHTDCSTHMTMEEVAELHFCEEKATYQDTTLAKFVKRCSPKAWRDFFTHKRVSEAIERADDAIRYAKKEIDAIQAKQPKLLRYRYHIEPPMQLMLEAFNRVSPENIKVVILGQDPTPQEGKATGRAFSVEDPRTVGSVMNVLLEVALEGWSVDLSNGDLSKWENQGVLLLNSALTIGEIEYIDENDNGKIKRKQVSHLGYWCEFTKLLIRYISYDLAEPSVWILWGNVAQDFTVDRVFDTFSKCYNPTQASTTDITKEQSLISRPKNYVLMGGHPSPLSSAGGMNTFFAGHYFHCVNLFLYEKRHGAYIKWGLVDGHSEKLNVGSLFYPCPEFH
ncbi:uncharacterized protein LOC110046550 isoform X2 [Orbicella faveolata]|uniref:uncharacterized protein LOC110046550 isoform X2 n=1 Tax=Orbicella faveolata TaxID=48498 RepID=UPI0009E2B243|nr:uncharacterized protein LOC110046550 isoform X2 [Orbicella faveolata]